MTLDELRREVGLIGVEFDELAVEAERDEFAPWIVDALRCAAHLARGALSPEAIEDARCRCEAREARA
jgi:hypothetical protein